MVDLDDLALEEKSRAPRTKADVDGGVYQLGGYERRLSLAARRAADLFDHVPMFSTASLLRELADAADFNVIHRPRGHSRTKADLDVSVYELTYERRLSMAARRAADLFDHCSMYARGPSAPTCSRGRLRRQRRVPVHRGRVGEAG